MTANFISSSHFDVLNVEGVDAARFLQGQVSCDINALADPGCCYGAALNTKGRVIALFLVLTTESGYLLILNKGLGEILSAHLQRFLAFYKSRMHLVENANFSIWYGPDALATLTLELDKKLAPGTGEILPAGKHYNIGSKHFHANLLTLETLPGGFSESNQHQESNLDAWTLAAARNGHYPFSASDSGQFTAQELRLEHHGYISFEKGCYTGQEIVARMHYRSIPKKQLFRIEFYKPDISGLTAENFPDIYRDGHPVAKFLTLLPVSDSSWCGLIQLPVDPYPHIDIYQIDSGEVFAINLF